MVSWNRILFTYGLSAVLVPSLSAQEAPLRIEVDLVNIPVTVSDKNFRYVPNLKRENFRIFENDIEQEISNFFLYEQPITTLVLLDRSGSMTAHLPQMASAANLLVEQFREQDQIAAATFADSVIEVIRLTKIANVVRPIKLQRHGDDRGTKVYDAVDQTLKKAMGISGRKAIILFSDGYGDGFFASAAKNLRDAEEGDSLIYTIQFDPSLAVKPSLANQKRWLQRREAADQYMRDLAFKTGGRHYRINEISDLNKTFRHIVNELRMQYILCYYPNPPAKGGERRKITVTVNVPNLVVRARNEVVYNAKKNK